jgi:putative copper resistance protein D
MTDWLSVLVRAGLYIDLALLFGLPMFGLYALTGAERRSVLPFRACIAGLALLGLALSALGIITVTATMGGVPLSGVDRESLTMVITQTNIGTAWQVRICVLLVTACFAWAVGQRKGVTLFAVMTGAAGISLASLAWTGHGAASDGRAGLVHLWADIFHLLAAGAWIGGIAAFGLLLFRSITAMTHEHLHLSHRTLDRFSLVGSLIVGLIVASGLVNSYMLVGPAHISELPFTLYGQLLLVKLALFAAMLALAAANRFRLTPALKTAMAKGNAVSAVAALRRSLAWEAGAALAILGLVAWMGTLAPPMSAA